jgi:hypothetical protein
MLQSSDVYLLHTVFEELPFQYTLENTGGQSKMDNPEKLAIKGRRQTQQ